MNYTKGQRDDGSLVSTGGVGTVVPLTNAAGGAAFSAAETGTWVLVPASACTFFAKLSNTTTPTATVEIHGSHYSNTTPGAGTLLSTLTLSGANDVASAWKDYAHYPYKCAKVTAISGTSATVTVTLGY